MSVKQTGMLILHWVSVAIGVVGVLVVLPFVLPLILLLMGVSRIRARQSEQRYAAFLAQHEGAEFFCYTNRMTSRAFVEEHILSALDPHIHIIQLAGRKPISTFDETYISHMLHNIEQIGFPNVLKIVNGHVVDTSLHDEWYAILNQKRNPDVFLQALEAQLARLRKAKGDSIEL